MCHGGSSFVRNDLFGGVGSFDSLGAHVEVVDLRDCLIVSVRKAVSKLCVADDSGMGGPQRRLAAAWLSGSHQLPRFTGSSQALHGWLGSFPSGLTLQCLL